MLPDIVIGCFMTSSGILHSGNLLKPARFHLIFFRFPKFQSMKWHPFWRSILLLLWSSCFLKKATKNDEIFTVDLTLNVRTFWETHKIWKNLPHGFDVYEINQDLSKLWGWFFQILWVSHKVWTLNEISG